MFVKVCGLSRIEEIEAAAEMGYSAAGIVMHRPSVRYVEPKAARKLARFARGKILTVGVALNYEELCGLGNEFDFIQLYEPVWKKNLIFAGDNPPPEGKEYKFFLYDTSRGSGAVKLPPLFLRDIRERLIIAGGLNPERAGAVVRIFKPAGVDVSSGVESSRGVKDFGLMEKFIQEVRNAAR